jgi:hypothetical protein
LLLSLLPLPPLPPLLMVFNSLLLLHALLPTFLEAPERVSKPVALSATSNTTTTTTTTAAAASCLCRGGPRSRRSYLLLLAVSPLLLLLILHQLLLQPPPLQLYRTLLPRASALLLLPPQLLQQLLHNIPAAASVRQPHSAHVLLVRQVFGADVEPWCTSQAGIAPAAGARPLSLTPFVCFGWGARHARAVAAAGAAGAWLRFLQQP